MYNYNKCCSSDAAVKTRNATEKYSGAIATYFKMKRCTATAKCSERYM